MSTQAVKSEQDPTPTDRGLLRSLAPKLAISLALGGLFAFLVSRGGMPLIPSAEELSRVDPGLLGAYAAVLTLMHLVRASRWRFLIAPAKADVPFWQGILINWVGFFAIFVLPLRIGELARPAVSKMRLGVPLSVGFGTVAVERVFDGLLTACCVVWGLSVLPQLVTYDPIAQSLPYYGWLAVTMFGAAFAGLVLFLWQRAIAKRLVQLTFGLVSRSLAARLSTKVEGVADGIRYYLAAVDAIDFRPIPIPLT